MALSHQRVRGGQLLLLLLLALAAPPPALSGRNAELLTLPYGVRTLANVSIGNASNAPRDISVGPNATAQGHWLVRDRSYAVRWSARVSPATNLTNASFLAFADGHKTKLITLAPPAGKSIASDGSGSFRLLYGLDGESADIPVRLNGASDLDAPTLLAEISKEAFIGLGTTRYARSGGVAQLTLAVTFHKDTSLKGHISLFACDGAKLKPAGTTCSVSELPCASADVARRVYLFPGQSAEAVANMSRDSASGILSGTAMVTTPATTGAGIRDALYSLTLFQSVDCAGDADTNCSASECHCYLESGITGATPCFEPLASFSTNVSDPVCRLPCQNGGTCDLHDTCTCPQNWRGGQCELAICDKPCMNGGNCTQPNVCNCSSWGGERGGWEGPTCNETIVCEPTCENGGVCQKAANACLDADDGGKCRAVATKVLACGASADPAKCRADLMKTASGKAVLHEIPDADDLAASVWLDTDMSNDGDATKLVSNAGTRNVLRGNHLCECQVGWNGTGCSVDVDECDPNFNGSWPHHGVRGQYHGWCAPPALGIARSTCTNTRGNYTCSCQAGHTGDGYYCYEAVNVTLKLFPGALNRSALELALRQDVAAALSRADVCSMPKQLGAHPLARECKARKIACARGYGSPTAVCPPGAHCQPGDVCAQSAGISILSIFGSGPYLYATVGFDLIVGRSPKDLALDLESAVTMKWDGLDKANTLFPRVSLDVGYGVEVVELVVNASAEASFPEDAVPKCYSASDWRCVSKQCAVDADCAACNDTSTTKLVCKAGVCDDGLVSLSAKKSGAAALRAGYGVALMVAVATLVANSLE